MFIDLKIKYLENKKLKKPWKIKKLYKFIDI